MKEYLDTVANGIEEVQNISISLQQEIFQELGINEGIFARYQHELGAFMQQLMMEGQTGATAGIKDMSLEEVKYAVRLQSNFIQSEGEALADQIIQATANWPPQRKQSLPMMMSVIIADGAFEGHDEIDEEAVQQAESKSSFM